MKQIEEKLRSALSLSDPGLIGCRRRNAWDDRSETPWRWLRGNSLLAILGEKREFHTEVGTVEAFMLHDWLLQFRGGQWNADWYEDFLDLWSVIRYNHEDVSHTIIVVHENRSELDIKMVTIPEDHDYESRLSTIIDQLTADPPGRIPKSGPRALRVCKWCPHKKRCDATDQLRGETNDYHPSYPRST